MTEISMELGNEVIMKASIKTNVDGQFYSEGQAFSPQVFVRLQDFSALHDLSIRLCSILPLCY